MNIEKQLKLSIDYSKVAVGILSNDSEEYDFKMALDKQLNKPKQFIEEIHEDDFGHSYITRKTGPGAYLELKKKWTQVEFLITCIYFDESVHGEPPSAQDFHLYKVEKNDNKVEKLAEINVHLLEDLEGAILTKWQDNADFKTCLIDNGILLHLLEDIMPCE
ncbi:hypothetical protein [Fibrobacter sp.]|uniref:hypothetical protein n=2 Tax=Fibrobacter TaxID=832 RepID=UPI002602438E|nr:hypothetical protein [Fibrobacter sp.]MDD7498114.1 hypothetical protein [Fibrobacter sp.]MDY5724818.1 hypothetical protein [Fibrobacter sp.]